MMSLNTAFKKVYGEALEPYGFKKIKGKYPYFARVIGEEIVHVITYINTPMIVSGKYKAFDIECGVETVYVPKIDLDIPPRHNGNWMKDNLTIYRRTHPDAPPQERFNEMYEYVYDSTDENSLIEAMKKSFQHVEEIMLPHLDEVRDYKACIEHYNHYAHSQIFIHEDFWNRRKHADYDDGPLQFKVFTAEEYADREKNRFKGADERDLQDVKEGRMTMEEFEIEKADRDRRLKADIALFEKYANNPENNRILMEELESRRRENTEILRGYGLI
ncbi:MAG: hypothetical protein NC225_08540 [Clostridium sp.]|nr:hypothetical protein [Clostridium sp.]MCM1460066.1 hypothetical protein [Bacteroides sp.]